MDQHLNILVQSSDFYAPFAGVMLTSLFENNQDITQITIYLMTFNMSDKNRSRFQILAEQYHRELKFIDTKEIDSFLEKHHVSRHRGAYTTYYKIFALSAIKDDIDRLIYLDSDMVVTGSLSELMNYDLSNNPLGMCIDVLTSKYKRLLKLDSLLYYNAGMIIFDVKKWIECRGMDRIIEHISTVHSVYPHVDQDLLNIVCLDSIATIPQKYNCYPVIYLYRDYNLLKKSCGLVNYYSEAEVISARQEPAILHAIEVFGIRPWHDGVHPYKEVWRKYLSISPWNDFTFLQCKVSVFSRMQGLLFKIMPKKFFAIVNSNCIYILLFWKSKKCEL